MRRSIFTEEHDVFRSEFRRFAESELAPKTDLDPVIMTDQRQSL
jgi:hypothetical protein